MSLDLAEQGLLPHHAHHPFMVHGPSSPLQGLSHPPIARAWKVQNKLLKGITQRYRFSQLLWLGRFVLAGIVPGAIDEAPACRAHGWKGAASPDMPVQL